MRFTRGLIHESRFALIPEPRQSIIGEMSREEKIESFNPNDPGQHDGNLFGLPFTPEEARIVVLPVPWDVTTSYRPGTSAGPQSILAASKQIDLYDPALPDAWKLGVAMVDIPEALVHLNHELRPKAEQIILAMEQGIDPSADPLLRSLIAEVNAGCARMVDRVRTDASGWLDQGKRVVGLGGDHSTPLGLLQALAERHDTFGVLQIDAHADLREAYEHFTFSHASILLNALKLDQISSLVQVGLRDVCEEEVAFTQAHADRIHPFTDRDIKHALYRGETLAQVHQRIVDRLPGLVYITLDIDGLDPALCPHTGTPVPGGLAFEACLHLVECVVASGRTIIGFDLNEVSPGKDDEWDANVGARLLFRLINQMAVSQRM